MVEHRWDKQALADLDQGVSGVTQDTHRAKAAPHALKGLEEPRHPLIRSIEIDRFITVSHGVQRRQQGLHCRHTGQRQDEIVLDIQPPVDRRHRAVKRPKQVGIDLLLVHPLTMLDRRANQQHHGQRHGQRDPEKDTVLQGQALEHGRMLADAPPHAPNPRPGESRARTAARIPRQPLARQTTVRSRRAVPGCAMPPVPAPLVATW